MQRGRAPCGVAFVLQVIDFISPAHSDERSSMSVNSTLLLQQADSAHKWSCVHFDQSLFQIPGSKTAFTDLNVDKAGGTIHTCVKPRQPMERSRSTEGPLPRVLQPVGSRIARTYGALAREIVLFGVY
jgi:hypothetical protein